MFASKSNVETAVQQKTDNFQQWRDKPENKNIGFQNGMVGCVFVQQVSANRYRVGWRFTPAGTAVGTIQRDCHAAYNQDQVIKWVENSF